MLYICKGILFSLQKDGDSDSMDELWNRCAKENTTHKMTAPVIPVTGAHYCGQMPDTQLEEEIFGQVPLSASEVLAPLRPRLWWLLCAWLAEPGGNTSLWSSLLDEYSRVTFFLKETFFNEFIVLHSGSYDERGPSTPALQSKPPPPIIRVQIACFFLSGTNFFYIYGLSAHSVSWARTRFLAKRYASSQL